MSAFRQIAAVVVMNARALHARMATSLVIVVGMAAVVAVSLSIFSVGAGWQHMTKETTSPDRMAISGAGGIDAGGVRPVPRDTLPLIASTPGIKLGSDGKPLLYGNVVAPNFFTRRKDNGMDVIVRFRGVAPNFFEVQPELKIIEGRMFTPGLREILAGKGAVGRFEGVALGAEIRLSDGPWKVVGIVDGLGGLSDFLLWGDADTVGAAYRQPNFTTVFARLEDGTLAGQEAFKAAAKANPSVSVDVETEEQFQMRTVSGAPLQLYTRVAYGVGAIMGLGAIFAALNTMYAAVSARVTEIATLRAIGFGAAPVVVSVLLEAIALALLGAVIGAVFAWAAFGGRTQSQTYMEIKQVISLTMIAVGIGGSLLVGFIGALFPAIRAARLPVTVALQAR